MIESDRIDLAKIAEVRGYLSGKVGVKGVRGVKGEQGIKDFFGEFF